MRTTAKYKDYSFNKEGDIEVTFTVDSRFIESIVRLEQTHDNKTLELKVNQNVAQKTERQNSAVWKLIAMMCEKMHGQATTDNKNDLYAQIITIAGIKTSYVEGLPEIENELKKYYTVVLVKDRRTSLKGVSTNVYELYSGLSTFNKEETNLFIETILDYSNKLGMPVSLESDYLRSLIER